ncbi:MAG: universal stress protein [Hyphomicrobiaceae bacterium]|nr:universal stress protein [Hyphomicrobiaceae bacterium]
MSYKTVLAHINDERRAARLIEFAALFAKAHDAHLIGLFVVPLPVVLNEWPDIAIAEMIEAQRKAYREEGERIAAIFEEKTAFLPRPAEWRQQESQYATVAEALVQNARMADIVIAPQADLSWHLTHTLDAAEAVIMEGGRPVLVVPNEGDPQPTPAHVTIAWNGRREAARAAFDAMPIIEKAGQADIVWIDPRTGSQSTGDLPCAELAVTIARHGVKAEAKAIQAEDEGVSAALREEAKRNASGLLVMGAYGHSRLREFVMGGATRNTMRDMTIPVLFSH